MFGREFTIWMAPDEIMALPGFLDRRRVARPDPRHEVVARVAELIVSRLQLGIVAEAVNLHLRFRKHLPRDRQEEAERLALLKPGDSRLKQLPVHREGIWQPVALD